MHVIALKALKEFWAKHADAEAPLKAWHSLMEHSSFRDPHEVRAMFPGVDFVGRARAVFDIGGNKYRLVADLRYHRSKVYVVAVLTHAEYDRADVEQL